jgi:hypothetical protein
VKIGLGLNFSGVPCCFGGLKMLYLFSVIPMSLATVVEPYTPVVSAFLERQMGAIAQTSSSTSSQSAIQPSPLASNWTTKEISPGVTAYVPPGGQEIVLNRQSNLANRDVTLTRQRFSTGTFDGTIEPYLSEIGINDLKANPIGANRYEWKTEWKGEGYERIDRQLEVTSKREGGANLHLTVMYDATIRNPKQNNLIITVRSDQDETDQLTNISAFKAGQTRKDFKQLRPDYDVFFHKNLGFQGIEKKVLRPLGTVTFAYHVQEKDLNRYFPMKLQAINQHFEKRQAELALLETQGWDVRELPWQE